MAFNVQNDQGSVTEANAYNTVEFFKGYCEAAGKDISAYSDSQIETAIVRATIYVDARFEYVGRKLNREQTTAWPRSHAFDADGYKAEGIPRPLKNAVAEYTIKALEADLMAEPENDGVTKVREKVGPLETEVQYAQGLVSGLPRYPLADNILRRAGLISGGRSFVRS